MPSIITASQLRAVLGVSSTKWSDSTLDDIIDTAEQVILPMLTTFSAPIEKVSLSNNVATYTTTGLHEFTEGQSVVVTGCGSPFNATVTVIDVTDYTFTAAITASDVIEKNIIPAGLAKLSGASTYVGNAAVESAVYMICTEVFQSRISAGGSIEGVDMSPSPFKLGRSLFNKVTGVLGAYIDVESMIQ